MLAARACLIAGSSDPDNDGMIVDITIRHVLQAFGARYQSQGKWRQKQRENWQHLEYRLV